MLVSILLVCVAGLGFFVGYRKFKSKKDASPLKEGDYVLLRHAYYREYPGIPKDQALTVDKIEGEIATVFYMVPSEILRAEVRKNALRKVS